jgi:hypothetical protein
MRIEIVWNEGRATGVLNDSENARQVYEALPIEAEASRWGDEVYFKMPVKAQLGEAPKQVVPRGSICYWVQGSALALAFGPTPISEGNECRLVTAVNILGSIDGDPRVLDAIQEGDLLSVRPLEEQTRH